MPSYANPQSLNRYSYVFNAPLNYVDPSGHDPWWCTSNSCLTNYVQTQQATWSNLGGNDDKEEPEKGDFCDAVLGCENPDAGVFCDQVQCWYDGATDISGTWEDPAVYISGGVACLGTGLCISAVASGLEGISWQALRMCAAVTVCLTLAIRMGIYYPPNEGFAGNTIYSTLQEGQIITRYGNASGSYASPIGTTLSQRALPFHQWNAPLTGYQVVRPFGVTTGVAQSYYGLRGGGIQYWFRQPMQYYTDNEFLAPLP